MGKKTMRLEYGFLTDLWATLMDRFSSVNVALQSSSLDLNNEVALLESLCKYIVTLHEQFDIFAENGKALSGCSEYKEDSGRKRTGVFLAIIDNMTGTLKKRLDAYTVVRNSFGFCTKSSSIWLQRQSAKVPDAWLKHIWKILNAIWRMNLCSSAVSPAVPVESSNVTTKSALSFACRAYRIALAPSV